MIYRVDDGVQGYAAERDGTWRRQLKPCPFCAAERTVEICAPFEAGHIAHLHCEACGADGPSIFSDLGAQAATNGARAAWGRRTDPKQGEIK